MKLILCGGPGGEGAGTAEDVWGTAAALQAEIGIAVEVGRVGSASAVLRLAEWESEDLDFWNFDRLLDRLEAAEEPLLLAGPWASLPAFAREVATRAQRLSGRRNAASSGGLFDRMILARHRALHDLDLPLVRADYDHALDVWQWLLRLEPAAGLAVQIAALFHDVERLESEAEVRREPHGPAYQSGKEAHAERGARMAAEVLAEAGVDEATRERAARLIAVHEGGAAGACQDAELAAEAALLADADALSFFSLNSPGYLAYHGPEATRRKVAWTWARMRPAAREQLAGVRLPSPVRGFLAEEVRGGKGRAGQGTPSHGLPPSLEKTREPADRTGSPAAVAGAHAP